MVLDRASLDSQRIQERRCDSFLVHLVFHHEDRKIYEMQKASSRACYNARFWKQLSKMRHGKPTGQQIERAIATIQETASNLFFILDRAGL